MRGILFATILLSLYCGTFSQTSTLTGVALRGGTDRRGRLEATFVTTVGPTSTTLTTTVCGPINLGTAFVVCNNIGFIASTEVGTVSDLNIPEGSGGILIRNLTCSGSTSLSGCTFSTDLVSACTHAQDVALACNITPGEAAGIGIGLLLFCLLITVIPIIICCCCFCGLCACLSST